MSSIYLYINKTDSERKPFLQTLFCCNSSVSGRAGYYHFAHVMYSAGMINRLIKRAQQTPAITASAIPLHSSDDLKKPSAIGISPQIVVNPLIRIAWIRSCAAAKTPETTPCSRLSTAMRYNIRTAELTEIPPRIIKPSADPNVTLTEKTLKYTMLPHKAKIGAAIIISDK